jgi:transcriptional regulator with XRE-family HTH domain
MIPALLQGGLMTELKLLGQRIRELRKARGLSQEELAERIESGAKYVSALERGQKNVPVAVLVRVARALRVELVDLFNLAWLKLLEPEIKKRIKTLVDDADLRQLQDLLCLLKSREL